MSSSEDGKLFDINTPLLNAYSKSSTGGVWNSSSPIDLGMLKRRDQVQVVCLMQSLLEIMNPPSPRGILYLIQYCKH